MSENLYKRGSTWWGRITAAGSEYRRSLRTSDRSEAKKRLEAWRKEITAAVYFGDNRMTWKAAVVRYTAEVMPTQVKDSTGKRYRCSFKQIDSHLGDLYVDQIDRKRLIDLINSRRIEGATNSTINRDLTAISQVLGMCVDWGVAERNVTRDLERRRVSREKRDPIVLPDLQDIDRVIEACPQMLGHMARGALLTGMRQEEIASLIKRQLNLKAANLQLFKTKTSRARSVPLSPKAVDLFNSIPVHLKSPFVFWHGNGDRYKNVSSRFAEIVKGVRKKCEEAKIEFNDFRFHDLRHRFAVDYLRSSGSIYDLQQILGHASIKTTEIYLAYLTPQEAQNARRGTVSF